MVAFVISDAPGVVGSISGGGGAVGSTSRVRNVFDSSFSRTALAC